MLLGVFERASLMLMALFLLTRARPFQHIIQKQQRRPIETALLSLLFTLFAVFSTYTGIDVDGSLVNVRIVAIISGGILFGPWVGIPAGIISGIHRYLIDINGPTSLPCLITSMSAGLLATAIYFKIPKKNYALWGCLSAVFCEIATMILIVFLAADKALAYNIISHISFPMIVGSLSIGILILLVQYLDEETNLVAAKQAKLALDIANKTLPYFRKNTREALTSVCNIIRQETQADVVAITDTLGVLAYTGVGAEHYFNSERKIGKMTQQAVDSGKQIISNNLKTQAFHSLLIIPLWENGKVSGTLKIFYRKAYCIKPALREMATGLSQLISTQMEISRVEELKMMASQAEFSALQSKINPHFLFNALSAISTLIRIRPEQARLLITELADFLRYNLEQDTDLIDIQKALQQVRSYIAIEKARFGKKLNVSFDIDDVHFMVPCLLLQPLVENAILHGIQPSTKPAKLCILIKKHGAKIKVTITDTGVGIEQSVIDKLYNGSIETNHIGLTNVHQRLLLLYGEGLHVKRLNPGTEMMFYLNKEVLC
ncbi:signal transduction histidine kinase, LytS [Psychromonas sp. CNPT3]|uniref:LytS/YhcK type 5TM receptor domain-containing protein n=1 Tax=Psychromonas sp. CNPT3 TaxID=314282 RepID=UPI00006E9E30|nr:LytS/YhcK type 5TM receptor domain-containing protein [Psychromonas sp. CNPT3]AGH80914.1 signal transduction histidine kinase, LytS [Psychromonas sp. CNPT3]